MRLAIARSGGERTCHDCDSPSLYWQWTWRRTDHP